MIEYFKDSNTITSYLYMQKNNNIIYHSYWNNKTIGATFIRQDNSIRVYD